MYFASASCCISGDIPLNSYAAENVRRSLLSSSRNSGIRLLLTLSICAILVFDILSIEAMTSRRRPDWRSYPLIFFPSVFIRSRHALRRCSSSMTSLRDFVRYAFAMMISTCSSSSSCGVVSLQVAISKSLYPCSTRCLSASHRLSPATILYSPCSFCSNTTSRFCLRPYMRMSPASSSISAKS